MGGTPMQHSALSTSAAHLAGMLCSLQSAAFYHRVRITAGPSEKTAVRKPKLWGGGATWKVLLKAQPAC